MDFDKEKILERLFRETYEIDEKSEKEKEYMGIVFEKAIALRKSLNNQQTHLFSEYVDALNNYYAISKKTAFFRGAKLAAVLFYQMRKTKSLIILCIYFYFIVDKSISL